MALTWKNVEAPNFNGAGALFESAQTGFNNAMETLQSASDRAAAQRRAAYSAQMLQGLAGVGKGGVSEFLKGQDAAMLTPEALQVALNQEEVLAGRAAKEVELQNAQGDLNWEKGSREGLLASAAARTEAQRRALTGDRDGAFSQLQGLQGFQALASLEAGDMGTVASGYNTFQNQRNTEDDWAQKIDRRNTEEFGRDFVMNNVIPNVLNKQEGLNAIMQNQNLSPKEKEAAAKSLASMTDEQVAQTNPDQLGALDLDTNLKTNFNNVSIDSDFISTDINNRKAANPLITFKDNLDRIQSVKSNPEAAPQSAADMLKAGGVRASADWFNIGGPNQVIDNVISDLKKSGLTASREEVVAAMQATAQTSSLPWNDDLVNNTQETINLLKSAKDPQQMGPALEQLQQFTSDAGKIDEIQTKIVNLDSKYKGYLSKGQVDKAAKVKEDMGKLLQEAADFGKTYRDSRITDMQSNAAKLQEEKKPDTRKVSKADATAFNSFMSSLTGAPMQVPATPYTGDATGPILPPSYEDQLAAQQAQAQIIQQEMLAKAAQQAEMQRQLQQNMSRPMIR